jgi:hypothetical protein
LKGKARNKETIAIVGRTIGPHVLLFPWGGACQGHGKHKKEELAMNTLIRSLVIALGLITFATSSAWAEGLTIPNTFTAGTPAKANEVNQNFSAVAAALPMVWANIFDGGTVTGTGDDDVNTITFVAPSDGVIVIQGDAYVVNNDATNVAGVRFSPNVDGSYISGFVSAFNSVSKAGVDGDKQTVNYCHPTSITAGSHTVTNRLEVLYSTDYTYNMTRLTITFYPSSQASITATSIGFGASEDEEDLLTPGM